MVAAVLFAMDDTLFPRSSWLRAAQRVVADAGVAHGLDRDALFDALIDVSGAGPDQAATIDRALARVDADPALVPPLLAAFRSHAPAMLPRFPGVSEALVRLGQFVPLALVTDGDPVIQRAKLRALDFDAQFSSIVLSDELGPDHRKPDALPFTTALDQLGVPAADAVFIGDHPGEDVAGARAAGLRAIRVHTGPHGALPDEPRPWASVPDVPAAAAFLVRNWLSA